MKIKYYLNNVDFETYNVYVSESSGLLDSPKRKDTAEMSYPYIHGSIKDLSSYVFNDREISLSCFIYSQVSITDLIQKQKAFVSQFEKPGIMTLRVDIEGATPMYYLVYLDDQIQVKKQWKSKNTFVCTFTLKLKEPYPVKKILRTTIETQGESRTITLSLPSGYSSEFDIFWGDGTSSVAKKPSYSQTHAYSEIGDYIVIIAGNIDDILSDIYEDFEVLWSKL